jgi:predicted nucleotidyltransferase
VPINADFRDLLSAFNEGRVRYLVVGAYAVIHHTQPRYTKDLDLWVERHPANAQRVLASLRRFGAPTRGLTAADLCNPELVYQIGIEPNRIDILMDLPGLDFGVAWRRARRTTYGGVRIRVLSLEDLLVTKRRAGRPQDLLDVQNLLLCRRRSRRK